MKERIAQLYEQGTDAVSIGQYVRRWLRWTHSGLVDQPFLFEHGQQIGLEQFGQGSDADFRHDMENTASAEQSVGHDSVDMRMPFCVMTKRLVSHHRADDSILQPENGSEKNNQNC